MNAFEDMTYNIERSLKAIKSIYIELKSDTRITKMVIIVKNSFLTLSIAAFLNVIYSNIYYIKDV